MSSLKIVTYPDEFLHQPTKPVENIDGEFQDFVNAMAATMYANSGVGLAAIQVGKGRSFLIYDVQQTMEEGRPQLEVLVNPRIVEREGQMLSESEGCLSVPGYRSDVRRAERVLVEGFDREGSPLRIEADGFLSIVLQHEIDHLEGRLFVDRLSALKRQLFKRRMLKQLKPS